MGVEYLLSTVPGRSEQVVVIIIMNAINSQGEAGGMASMVYPVLE